VSNTINIWQLQLKTANSENHEQSKCLQTMLVSRNLKSQ